MFNHLTAALAATLLCAIPACPGRAAEPTKVVLAFPSEGFLYVPIYAAQKLGYFAEEGLDVEVVATQTPTSAFPLLPSGREPRGRRCGPSLPCRPNLAARSSFKAMRPGRPASPQPPRSWTGHGRCAG